MTTTFAATIAKIKGQAEVLSDREERAVELTVIVPILRDMGWNTDDPSEIYPQKPLLGASRGDGEGKVDYALQIGGKSRVLIEVKRWSLGLNEEHEKQLSAYCREGKPNLAILTNGRQWRFYLPPVNRKSVRQTPGVREFLAFEITGGHAELEGYFARFLAREKFVGQALNKTLADARALHQEITNKTKVMKALTDYWNQLSVDRRHLITLLGRIAEWHDIQANDELIEEFLATKGNLVNTINESPPGPSKPVSITFSDPGRGTVTRSVNSWPQVIQNLCDLMYQGHPDDCKERILAIQPWFSEVHPGGFAPKVQSLGIYAKPVGGPGANKIISLVISEFGYPENSFSVKMSG